MLQDKILFSKIKLNKEEIMSFWPQTKMIRKKFNSNNINNNNNSINNNNYINNNNICNNNKWININNSNNNKTNTIIYNSMM